MINIVKKQDQSGGRTISAGPSAIKSMVQNKTDCKRKQRTRIALKCLDIDLRTVISSKPY